MDLCLGHKPYHPHHEKVSLRGNMCVPKLFHSVMLKSDVQHKLFRLVKRTAGNTSLICSNLVNLLRSAALTDLSSQSWSSPSTWEKKKKKAGTIDRWVSNSIMWRSSKPELFGRCRGVKQHYVAAFLISKKLFGRCLGVKQHHVAAVLSQNFSAVVGVSNSIICSRTSKHKTLRPWF